MKKKEEWNPVVLKPLLDHLKLLPESEYVKLKPFVEQGICKRKSKILQPGQIELESRLLIEGIVGKFLHGKLVRLYVAGDTCMDMESYTQQVASRFELRVLQDCSFSKLSFNNANLILNKYPQFAHISEELFRLARHKEEEWMGIRRLPYDQSRSILNKKYPGFESIITQSSLADLLGVNVKTISRDNERQFKANKLRMILDKFRQHLNYPFESKVHKEAKKLDSNTLAWASLIHKVLWENREVDNYLKMQFTWLPARLYPDADWQSITLISNLHVLLFEMDDFTDRLPDGMKGNVWQEIESGIGGVLNGKLPQSNAIRIQVFCSAFAQIWDTILEMPQVNKAYINLLKGEMEKYLASNRWEAENRDANTIPSIEEYRIERPLFSGGNLAIALIPLGLNYHYSEIQKTFETATELKQQASTLIFLTNDLFSFEKEKKLKDYHNLVMLLMHHKKLSQEQARNAVLEIHVSTLREFCQQSHSVNMKDPVAKELLKQLEYQIAGAVAWSMEDTSRYYSVDESLNL